MMKTSDGMRAIAEYIKNNDKFVIISHIAPDGDTLGSALALYSAMKLLDKSVQVVCQDRVPQMYSFLPFAKDFLTPEKAIEAQTAIAVDCADIGRLGSAVDLFTNAKTTISIDHHGTNTMYASHNEVDSNAAAVGEMIYLLIMELLGSVSPSIADCLYTAVMTDTGNFAFTNTTANSFLIAAELLKAGASVSHLNLLVYRTVSLAKTRLLGYALQTTELFNNNTIGLCVITQADMARCKAKAEDTEGIVDNIRNIDGVEIAIFVRECLDGEYKVSMRSKEYANVAVIAQNFGGGGHVAAAGFKTNVVIDKLIQLLLDAAKTVLNGDE